MTMMTWMDVLQIWDYKFCPTDENGMMQNGQWINQASDETQQYLLFWNDDLRNQSQISNATPGKLVLYYDNDRLLIHKSNTDDIRTFRKDTHLQQFDYDSMGILTSMDIPNQITLLKKRDDNWKNLPFVVNPELLTKLDIEAMTPPKTDILLFKVTGDPTAIEMMIMLWNQLYDQQWLQEKGRVMNIQLLDSSNIRILFRPMLPITALPSLVLKDEMKMRAIRSYLTSTTTKEIAPSNLIFKYEGRSIGRGCYPDAFSFDALRNFVQHAFATSSLGDPPSIVALGKRIGDGVVLKDSLDQRSQLLPQKERTNLGHLAWSDFWWRQIPNIETRIPTSTSCRTCNSFVGIWNDITYGDKGNLNIDGVSRTTKNSSFAASTNTSTKIQHIWDTAFWKQDWVTKTRAAESKTCVKTCKDKSEWSYSRQQEHSSWTMCIERRIFSHSWR